MLELVPRVEVTWSLIIYVLPYWHGEETFRSVTILRLASNRILFGATVGASS